jgi:hypothetical protein
MACECGRWQAAILYSREWTDANTVTESWRPASTMRPRRTNLRAVGRFLDTGPIGQKALPIGFVRWIANPCRKLHS